MKRFVLLALFVLIPCSAKAQVSIPVTNADFETYPLPAGGGFAAPFFVIDPADPFATSAPLIARLNADEELVSGAGVVAQAPLGWDIVMDEPLAPYVSLQNVVAAPILSPVASYQPGEADGQVGGIYLEVENENVPVGRVGLQQTLAETLQPNRSYTLSVDVGNIQSTNVYNFDGFPGYEVVVRAGNEVMTSDMVVNPIPEEGTFATYVIQFDTDADTAGLGEQITIELWNLNNPHQDIDVEGYNPFLNGIRANEVNFDNVIFEYVAIAPPVVSVNPIFLPLNNTFTSGLPTPSPACRYLAPRRAPRRRCKLTR